MRVPAPLAASVHGIRQYLLSQFQEVKHTTGSARVGIPEAAGIVGKMVKAESESEIPCPLAGERGLVRKSRSSNEGESL